MVVVQPTEPLDHLRRGLEALAAERVDGLSNVALGAELVELRGCIDRLEGEFLRRLGPFHRGGGALADGSVDTVSWLRGNCRLTGTVAQQRVSMAQALEAAPLAADSLCAGRASFTNTSLIARLAADVGREKLSEVEAQLVVAAGRLDAGSMRDLALATRVQLDPEAVLGRDNRNHERRWFAFGSTLGGMVSVRGELDADGGAVLKSAIDAMSSPSGPHDDRTGSQRRADALVDLASGRLQGNALGRIHGQRPHLVLTGSIEALRGDPNAEPARLAGVGPVHAEIARRIACDSAVRIAISGDGAAGPLSVGRETRSIPPHIRTALALRDQGCRFPRCDRPPEWADGHHIDHWVDLGPTEVPNLVLLCRRHHRFVHEKGWQVRMVDGVPVITPPP